MAVISLTVRVRIAWWMTPAISCIAFVCHVFRYQPDLDKVCALLMRGVRVEVC